MSAPLPSSKAMARSKHKMSERNKTGKGRKYTVVAGATSAAGPAASGSDAGAASTEPVTEDQSAQFARRKKDGNAWRFEDAPGDRATQDDDYGGDEMLQKVKQHVATLAPERIGGESPSSSEDDDDEEGHDDHSDPVSSA